jgi:hypothetical protein
MNEDNPRFLSAGNGALDDPATVLALSGILLLAAVGLAFLGGKLINKEKFMANLA